MLNPPPAEAEPSMEFTLPSFLITSSGASIQSSTLPQSSSPDRIVAPDT
jgi:hypothetical protein